MTDTIKLKPPAGCDTITLGTVAYVPDFRSGLIEIPNDAGPELIESLRVAGCVRLDAPGPDIPAGATAKVKHRSRGASFSFEGVTYIADAAGILSVPFRAISAARSHGFFITGS